MDITVIIPTCNRGELLDRTLRGFCEQDLSGVRWELIVVSDGSTDSTGETVSRFKDRLPLRYLPQAKCGVSSARNLALRESCAPIVLFVDDDIVPDPQLVSEHLRFHEEKTAIEAVLLGYVTWLPELHVTPFMRWYGEHGGLFAFSRLKNDREADPRYLYTCNVSFKSIFLRSNGGFNEHLSVLEDLELGFRLKPRGMKMYFRRRALGYHNQRFTFNEACSRLRRYSGGLAAFRETDAGRAMLKRRSSLIFRLAEILVRLIVPVLQPLRPVLDLEVRLPNAVYRLFYWYYGTYHAFWSRRDI